MLKNNKGIITIPFLLVLIIILFFILSFFGLAMTFAHVSVSQYLSYSTARKYSLAGRGQQKQKIQAQEHYQKLRSLFFKPGAYTKGSGDWFIIPTSLDVHRNIGKAFDDDKTDRNLFYGVSFTFTSRIPKFQIPFLVKDERTSLIKAGIFSFLGREPSEFECQEFNKARWGQIQRDYSFIIVPNANRIGKGDNGC